MKTSTVLEKMHTYDTKNKKEKNFYDITTIIYIYNLRYYKKSRKLFVLKFYDIIRKQMKTSTN